nr:cysteine-rich receptor-like protein kinase 2 [Ipomoea batatas]
MVVSVSSEPAFSDPQTTQLNKGCSQYNVTDVPGFFRRLNASFADLRSQLSDGEKRFATTQQPAYVMVQCRNYLSTADCVACYDAAVSAIRSCNAANGGRVIFDGCFLSPFNYTDVPDSMRVLNATFADLRNQLSSGDKRFATSTQQPVYAMAQCRNYLSTADCVACLDAAVDATARNCSNKTGGRIIYDGCFLRYEDSYFYEQISAGRAIAPGCFMRYSNKRFFLSNQTTNLAAFLETGSSSGKNKAIIAGVVGGVGIILVLAAIFLYLRSKNTKAARRGNILGATELRGPENYRYKDLKAATKGFSEENKLGQGGFGDVYKGTLKNGVVVAVKKLAMISGRAKADFETEVRLITNVHHRNLIRLLGCSAKGEELLLVYEYMANASLDRYIYEKVDIYSFGIVILEIISGRRSSDIRVEPVTEYLLEQAWKLYENGEHLRLVDSTLDPNDYTAEEVKRILEIALVCTQSPPNLRPSMSELVIMLSSDRPIFQNQPNRPTVISDLGNRIQVVTDASTTTASSASHATVSISDVSGR